MKRITGQLYIRKIEIVDDTDTCIYKAKDIPIKKGIQKALEIVRHKDGDKTVKNIWIGFIKHLDDDFKKLFDMEDLK